MEDIAEAVEQDGLTTNGELRETIEELWAFDRAVRASPRDTAR